MQAAIARAIDFVCASTGHELMTPEYRGGYDVRGWGYSYGLRFLLAARETGHVLEDQQAGRQREVPAREAVI